MSAETVDTVVIGAGAMGSTTAWQLAKAGRDVVLLEQFERLHDRGSSHGQTRVFRVSYRDPLYTDLAVTSIPRWRELEADAGVVLLEQTGQLDHGYAAAIDEIEAALVGAGFGYERLTPQAAAERWPALTFDTTVLFSPDGGRVFADRMVDAAISAAEQYGASVRFDTPVRGLEPHGDGVRVHTDDGSIEAASVVVAAGAWVTRLVGPGTGFPQVRLPQLSITRQQPVHFRVKPEMWFPSYIHHVPDASPGAALRFGAYGLESPGEGVKLGLETDVHCPDPDVPGVVDVGLIEAAVEYAEQWLPGADTSQVSAVTCLFTNTPDSHFIIDRVGPIVVCSPCSGHGFKFAPEIGALAADLAMDGERKHPEWRVA
jgi:sarcosine oxidase